MRSYLLSLLLLILPLSIFVKEVTLTFDDAPGDTTLHFTTEQRTDELIRKLKVLNVSPIDLQKIGIVPICFLLKG